MSRRVLYLIRSLETGGAERQLVALARGLDRGRYDPEVVTFFPGGALAADLEEAGIPHTSLDKAGRWDLLTPWQRLRAILRARRPALLHSYLTTGNLMALAARTASPETRLVWGWRSSAIETSRYDRLVGLTETLENRLADKADLVIANAQAGKRDRVARGVPAGKVVVVPNGIDCRRFTLDREAGAKKRAEWAAEGRIPEGAPLIGLMGRLDFMKGHETFLEAARLALEARPELRFVALGGGSDSRLADLKALAGRLGVADKVFWAGEQRPAAPALQALTLHTSASLYGEGFSNAVAEAMACGVPSVVTQIGDSAEIVGGLGIAVAPGQARALAHGWLSLLERLEKEGDSLRQACRRRIETEFSLEAMMAATCGHYDKLLSGSA